jgi:alpha-amylase
MPDVSIYFQVHQPHRLKPYTFFDLGKDHDYENFLFNKDILDKVSDNCYIPANQLMLKLINQFKGEFKITFSLSGVFIEQLEAHRPDVLASFIELSRTGCVEFLSETYYHSLSFIYSRKEFDRQVALHKEKIKTYFSQEPKVFRNTELIYSNELAKYMSEKGYKGIITEGEEYYLNGRTPNILYTTPTGDDIKIILRNNKLSDDIAFRFADKNWKGYPLKPKKFAKTLLQDRGDVVNLCMDYETIGEHLGPETGIFKFWTKLPQHILALGGKFITPGEAAQAFEVKSVFNPHPYISWADKEKNLSAWKGNPMQREALEKVFVLENQIKSTNNKDLLHQWAKLQTSDHFYYMSTKNYADEEVHEYFSPFDSPYDAYIYYMNALADFELEVKKGHENADKEKTMIDL